MTSGSSKKLDKKKSLLQSLLDNLIREENLLLAGDPMHALEWEKENSKILKKLIDLDKEWEEEKSDSLPYRETDILLFDEVYKLTEEARTVQIRVEKLLEEETQKARNELNEVSVKRQLKLQLSRPDGLYWKKRIC